MAPYYCTILTHPVHTKKFHMHNMLQILLQDKSLMADLIFVETGKILLQFELNKNVINHSRQNYSDLSLKLLEQVKKYIWKRKYVTDLMLKLSSKV